MVRHPTGWQEWLTGKGILELHIEDQEQDQAEPEDGDRLPDEGKRGHDMVELRVLLDRREDADRDGDQQRHPPGDAHQDERVRQAIQDLLRHRALGGHRHAQVTLQHAAQPLAVLHGKRIVQAQPLLQRRQILRH